MPVARVQLPDGRIGRFEVPEGTTPDQAQSLIQAQLPALSQPAAPQLPESLRPRTAAPEGIPGDQQEPGMMRKAGQVATDVLAGGVRGAGSIGATLIRPFESEGENNTRRQKIDEGLRLMVGADPSSLAYGAGKFGAEMAGTMGAGGVLALPVKAAARVVPQLATAVPALTSGGFAAQTTAGKIAAGAATGVAGAGLIDPESATTGGVIGAAVPLVPGVVAKGIGKLADLRQFSKIKAADIARNALGPDLPEVLNALNAAQGTGQSAAQATAFINSPTWQALIDRAVARDPRFLRVLEQSQGELSLNALAKLAGGTTATEVRATNELAKQTLNDVTSPARQASLARADKGMNVAALEAEAESLAQAAGAKVDDVRRLINAGNIAEASARLDLIKKNLPVGLTKYTYKGELGKMADEWASQAANASLDVGAAARASQSMADSLRAAGIKPLETKPLIDKLRTITRDNEYAGNDVMKASVDNLARDLAEWTNIQGIIPAPALDAIRKNSVTAAVRDLLKGQDPSIQREAAAGVMARIKPLLVDAVEAAGGKGYRSYLEDYSKGMLEIAKQKLSGEALHLWKTDKDAFVRLVQGDSPDAVEKILGRGNYNIATELADDTMKVLQEQAQKRLTDIAVKDQVDLGQDALKELLLQNINKFRLPSYLSALFSTTNKALNILENKIGKKTMANLTEALKTPEGAANLLESLPAAERSKVLQLIGDPSKWNAPARAAVTGSTAAGVNMLAPGRNIENEFVR